MHRLEVPEVFALKELGPMFHSPTPTSAAARLLGPEPINTNTERDTQRLKLIQSRGQNVVLNTWNPSIPERETERKNIAS